MKRSNQDVFDIFLKTWSFSDKYIVYGTSTAAISLSNKLGDKLNIVAYMDSDTSKWGGMFLSKKILSITEWREEYRQYKIIVASSAYTEIREFLTEEGLVERQDFCDSRVLIGSYFIKEYNEVYLNRTDLSITSYCNLNCEKCNMLMPYFKAPKHKSLEQLKEDIDTYFKWVDDVQIFNILGGEPFIYPNVEEITRYLCQSYCDKIEQIVFFTNGLVRLQESMLQLMKEYNIQVQISDYRNGIPGIADRIDEFMSKLELYGITYRRNIDTKWLDFGFPDYTNERNGEELIDFFDRCYSPFRGLNDKKIYYCNLSASAVCADLFSDNSNDYFDLSDYDINRKRELVEFDLGYTKLGYVTYCKKCKGCFTVNDEYTEVAKQKKRIKG